MRSKHLLLPAAPGTVVRWERQHWGLSPSPHPSATKENPSWDGAVGLASGGVPGERRDWPPPRHQPRGRNAESTTQCWEWGEGLCSLSWGFWGKAKVCEKVQNSLPVGMEHFLPKEPVGIHSQAPTPAPLCHPHPCAAGAPWDEGPSHPQPPAPAGTPATHPEGCDLKSEDPQTLLCVPLVTFQHPAQGWAAADWSQSQHPAPEPAPSPADGNPQSPSPQ